MATTKKSTKRESSKATASNNGMTAEESSLLKLFIHGLRDILWAEKALTKAIPKMVAQAEHEELRTALEEHLVVTENQVEKLKQVFEEIDHAPRAKKCTGMEGIITEGGEIMEEFAEDNIDGAILAAASKVEHYEMSSYMSLITLAEGMGLTKSVKVLQEILAEEMEADKVLQVLAAKLAA